MLKKFRAPFGISIEKLRVREKPKDDQRMQSIMDHETLRCATEARWKLFLGAGIGAQSTFYVSTLG